MRGRILAVFIYEHLRHLRMTTPSADATAPPKTPKNRKAIGPEPIGLGSRPIGIGFLPFRIGSRPLGLGPRPIPIGVLPFSRGVLPFRRGREPIRGGKSSRPPSRPNDTRLRYTRSHVTPSEFLEKWSDSAAERSNAQSFVIDLCDVRNVGPRHAATSDAD